MEIDGDSKERMGERQRAGKAVTKATEQVSSQPIRQGQEEERGALSSIQLAKQAKLSISLAKMVIEHRKYKFNLYFKNV